MPAFAEDEDHRIIEPIPAPRCFTRDDDSAVQAQAALLLCLGCLLHPAWRRTLEHDLSPEHRYLFPLPWGLEPVHEKIRISPSRTIVDLLQGETVPADHWLDQAGELAARLWDRPTTPTAARLILWSTVCPFPLVRAAALVSALDHLSGSRVYAGALMELWRDGFDTVPAQIAAVALGRQGLAPAGGTTDPQRHAAPPPPVAAPRVKAALLVHGTLAPSTSITGTIPRDLWWRPGGDFHNYLRYGNLPDLYDQSDAYDWEGGYGAFQHDVASNNLVEWQRHRDLYPLDVITHSHGGNMAMWASQKGATFNRLLMLSCPVHWAHRQPDAALLPRAQSIRILLDLVILADRGGQRFPAGTVAEHVLPWWFTRHGTTHNPATWRSLNLDRFL